MKYLYFFLLIVIICTSQGTGQIQDSDSSKIENEYMKVGYSTIFVNGNPYLGVITNQDDQNIYLKMQNRRESAIRHKLVESILLDDGKSVPGPSTDSTAYYAFLGSQPGSNNYLTIESSTFHKESEMNKHLDRIATTLERMFILTIVLIGVGVISVFAV